MDPGRADMDTVDQQAGGDNPLSAAQVDLARDKDNAPKSQALYSKEGDVMTDGTDNNSNAVMGTSTTMTLDPSPKQESLQESSSGDVETVNEDAQGVGVIKSSDNGLVEDISTTQEEEEGSREDAPEGASNIMDAVPNNQTADERDEDLREEVEDGRGKTGRGGQAQDASDVVDCIPNDQREDAEGKSLEEKEEDVKMDREGDQEGALDGGSKDSVHLRKRQRSDLFKEGLKLQETEGGVDKALGCYLGAITGLTEAEAFPELPRCLHQISDIYFEKKEYEKAVYFIQAEKMYYETALIDHVNIQKQLESTEDKGEESAESVQTTPPSWESDSPEVVKAKEFENLAKLCLKESKLQLALDYCGKATQIYRNVYGDDHPTTIGSLELFTMIYADVGKKLYADAMQKYDSGDKEAKASAEQPEEESDKRVTAEETTSDLRQRSQSSDTPPMGAQTSIQPGSGTGVELEPAPRPDEQDDWVTTCLLMLLFLLVTFLILLLVTYFYCLGNERSSICHQFKGDLSYWYMKIKHYYLGL